MSRKRILRLAAAALAAVAVVGMAAIAAQVPAQAAPATVDPSSLARGAGPGVAYLLHDTIHDGRTTVHATSGNHRGLWVVARGYLVLDGSGRLTYVSRTGAKELLGTKVYTVEVSPDRRRVVWGTYDDPSFGPPVHLTVANAANGSVVARRTFQQVRWAQAVDHGRVMLATSSVQRPGASWWWRLGHARLHRIIAQPSVRADVPHDRVVLSTGNPDRFCNRVARISHPRATLWRSCRFVALHWSPDGRHAIATHTYFDDTGTDFWAVVNGTTGHRVSTVRGRLDWNAVWEDNHHFLTSAMGEDGKAAVIRCDLHRHCERASRLWDTGWTEWPPFYVAPPVLLASN